MSSVDPERERDPRESSAASVRVPDPDTPERQRGPRLIIFGGVNPTESQQGAAIKGREFQQRVQFLVRLRKRFLRKK